MLTSGSRNGGSSLEDEDSEVESMDSPVLCNLQWGFTGGGWWEMMTAYLIVAMNEHTSLLLHLAQVGMSIDFVRSRVLPEQRCRWTSRCFNITTQMELLQGFRGSKREASTQK